MSAVLIFIIAGIVLAVFVNWLKSQEATLTTAIPATPRPLRRVFTNWTCVVCGTGANIGDKPAKEHHCATCGFGPGERYDDILERQIRVLVDIDVARGHLDRAAKSLLEGMRQNSFVNLPEEIGGALRAVHYDGQPENLLARALVDAGAQELARQVDSLSYDRNQPGTDQIWTFSGTLGRMRRTISNDAIRRLRDHIAARRNVVAKPNPRARGRGIAATPPPRVDAPKKASAPPVYIPHTLASPAWPVPPEEPEDLPEAPEDLEIEPLLEEDEHRHLSVTRISELNAAEREVVEKIFGDDIFSVQVDEKFEKYRGETVEWDGILEKVQDMTYDFVFGTTPAVRVEFVIGELEARMGIPQKVRAVVRFNSNRKPDLLTAMGRHVKFSGTLFKAKGVTKEIFLTDGQLHGQTPDQPAPATG